MKGHEIIGEAYDGEECINKLNHQGFDPDFVLMDHRMPIKNGLEATKELLKMNPNLKIIFFSDDISLRKEMLATGVVSFIHKPFNLNIFYNTLERLLREYTPLQVYD